MEIIFENLNYRVIKSTSQKVSRVTYICFDHWRTSFDIENPSDYAEPFAYDSINKLGFSYLSIQTRRNDWYQNEGIFEALECVANLKKLDDIFICYGCSMGGYAAISFHNYVNSDFFIALSPQVSLSPNYMRSIGDKRWKHAQEIFHHDIILEGKCKENRGIIIHDPTQTDDAKHIDTLINLTDAKIIVGLGGGHFPGEIINATYGLNKLLKLLPKIFRDNYKLDDCVDEVTISASQHYMAEFALAEIEKKQEMVAKLGIHKFTGHAIELIISDLMSEENSRDPIALLLYCCTFNEDAETRRKASLALAKKGYIRMAGGLVPFGELLGFFESGNMQAVLNEKEFIGASSFRDEALRLENQGDYEKAYLAIKIASELNPTGKFIQKKLEEYRLQILEAS